MSQPDERSPRERVEAIHDRYTAHFAGQARITRDSALLERLLEALEAVAVDVAAADPLQDVITARRELYTNEIGAIREAQAEGPDALAAHMLSTWADLVQSRYRRHFAGQSRPTRDLGLLAELVSDLERLHVEVGDLWERYQGEALAEVRGRVHESLALYREEQGAIATARGEGTLGEQASVLASLANAQFENYRGHFAGKSRLSRRPARLERMVANLEHIAERMDALQKQGLHDDDNDRNIGIVQERLGLYREELEAVRGARQGTSMERLVESLGEAANEVFDEYRESFAGKDRAGRDLAHLERLFEALHDAARQMDDLDRVREDPTNQANLALVLDRLRLYDREDTLIREAKSASDP